MKRLLYLFLFCWIAQSSQAQYYDHALGVRAGTTFGASYKQFRELLPNQPQQAIELLFGIQLDEQENLRNGYVLEGLYQLQFDIGFDTRFAGYIGAGGYIGLYGRTGLPVQFGAGLTGMLGLEYNFKFMPLNISLDWKPIWGMPRQSLTRGALSLRYIFPEPW